MVEEPKVPSNINPEEETPQNREEKGNPPEEYMTGRIGGVDARLPLSTGPFTSEDDDSQDEPSGPEDVLTGRLQSFDSERSPLTTKPFTDELPSPRPAKAPGGSERKDSDPVLTSRLSMEDSEREPLITGPLNFSSEPEQDQQRFDPSASLFQEPEEKTPTGSLMEYLSGVFGMGEPKQPAEPRTESQPPAEQSPAKESGTGRFSRLMSTRSLPEDDEESKKKTAPLKRRGSGRLFRKTGELPKTDEGEKAPGKKPPSPQAEDFVSEIRADLKKPESKEKPEKKKGGSSVLHKLTGSLFRVTGTIKEPPAPPAPEPEPAAPEMPAMPEFSEPEPSITDAPAASAPVDLEPPTRTDAEIALVESEPSDWMLEIRQEGLVEEAPAPDAAAQPPALYPEEETKPEVHTSSLRNFWSSVLRGGEETESPPVLPDDMVTGRLERSLGMNTAGLESPPPEAPAQPETPEDLQARLGSLDSPWIAPAGQSTYPWTTDAAKPEEQVFLTPEEESLLWGTPITPAPDISQPAEPVAAEDVWGEADGDQPPADAPLIGSDSLWPTLEELSTTSGLELGPDYQLDTTGSKSSLSDEAYAATFLTGSDYVPPQEQEPAQSDNLLRQALDNTEETEEPISIEEMRQIALEDYKRSMAGIYAATPDANVPAGAAAVEVPPVALLEPVVEKEAPVQKQAGPLIPYSVQLWWSSLTVLQRILAVEAVLVAIVLLIAIPFFLVVILSSPARGEVLAPRALPGDLPYPVGVTLPGGWHFPLDKSTFDNGSWVPDGSEWLEGTEFNRVIALPWNEQTEAVVRSFTPGDSIMLYLSSNHALTYRVEEVERVPVDEVGVFTDRKPSLVIVLYQEDADERWVVISRP